MNKDALNFINQQFDFDYDDQPDEINDYLPRIEYMWKRGEEMGLSKDIREALIYLVSRDDPEVELNSYFLSRKHDLREILQMALAQGSSSMPREL